MLLVVSLPSDSIRISYCFLNFRMILPNNLDNSVATPWPVPLFILVAMKEMNLLRMLCCICFFFLCASDSISNCGPIICVCLVQHVPKINGEIPSIDEATMDHERLTERSVL